MNYEPEELADALIAACDGGNMFVIRNFIVQPCRSPFTMHKPGSDSVDDFELGTAVIFAFIGANGFQEGIAAFSINSDDIDNFCAMLQIAKHSEVVSIDSPGLRHARVQFNKQKEG